jgi:hypothetical protein
MQPDFTIIVLGYKRLYSLQRLFVSLLGAATTYEKDKPLHLIFSIDPGGDEAVEHFCRNIFSSHFDITIIVHEKHLGPDKHNLWAMQQAETYHSVVILEDDTMVSPSIFYYARQSLNFYRDDEQVAGISLYNYERNEVCNYPFLKVNVGFDNYFYMKASSRGLLLTKEQWLRFKNHASTNNNIDIPQRYLSWSDDIWEKQFNIYLIRENKFWVYPRVSMTTNFGDLGTHVNREIYRHAFQTSMQHGVQKQFNFSELKNSGAVYDAYGEAVKIHGFEEQEITCDVLGERDLSKIKTKYILTTRQCSQWIEGYSMDLTPPELNLVHNLKGEDMKVTETGYINENYFGKLNRELRLHYYFYPDKGFLHLLRLKLIEIINRIPLFKSK